MYNRYKILFPYAIKHEAYYATYYCDDAGKFGYARMCV